MRYFRFTVEHHRTLAIRFAPCYNIFIILTQERRRQDEHHPLLPGARRAVPDAPPGEKVPRRQPRQVDRRGREI